MEDARSLLILLRSGLPASKLRPLLDAMGSAHAVLVSGPIAWRSQGIPPHCAALLQRPDCARIEADLEWLDGPGHHLLGWHDHDYPVLLRNSQNPPAALFVAGDPDLLWHPQIAVVGSRRPTAGGRDNARQFARAFGHAGFAVTSGLAAGVDAAAHRGAMEDARTVAVLGTGPDLCYPAANADLMRDIASNGAVVTEHPPGVAGRKEHFPSRNRLIAGLSLATVVIEAAMRSGALITARLAVESGREVFALPGSIHNPMARGCHRLLREGVGLAETPDEVIAALGPVAAKLSEALRARLDDSGHQFDLPGTVAPAPRVARSGPVWRALGHDPVNLDQLCERTGLTVGPLSAMLLTMELDGEISAEQGRYSRRS